MDKALAPHPHQTERFERKREAVLDAAAREFNKKGVKGATMSDVARSVELLTNSITYYYPRKADLVAACFSRAITLFSEMIDAASEQTTQQLRVRQFWQLYLTHLEAIAAHQAPVLMSFNDIRSLRSPHVDVVFAEYNVMFRKMRDLMFRNVESTFSRIEQNARTHLMISLMHGVRFWAPCNQTSNYVPLLESICDILQNGLAMELSEQSALRMPRLASNPDDTSLELFLRAATLLINEEGYRGASVVKISKRLKVTKGAFYHHVSSKDDLVTQCFERSFDVVRKIQAQAMRMGGSSVHRLYLACSELIRVQMSPHGPLLRLTAASALPDPMRIHVTKTLHDLSLGFGAFVRSGRVDGSLRDVDAAIAAHMVHDMVNAAAELGRWVPAASMGTAAELFARPLFTGLLQR